MFLNKIFFIEKQPQSNKVLSEVPPCPKSFGIHNNNIGIIVQESTSTLNEKTTSQRGNFLNIIYNIIDLQLLQ